MKRPNIGINLSLLNLLKLILLSGLFHNLANYFCREWFGIEDFVKNRPDDLANALNCGWAGF